MSLIKCSNIYSLPRINTPVCLSFGNFDGFHLGHKKLIEQLKNIASSAKMHMLPVVMTFQPHSASFLSPDNEEFLICSREKVFELISAEGIGNVIVLEFNEDLLNIDAEKFIESLVKNINVKCFVVGSDCRFGKNALGNINLIDDLSKKYDYSLHVVEKISLIDIEGMIISLNTDVAKSEIISSSVIRSLLKNGNVIAASSMLGRFHSIEGGVLVGQKRGSLLGFPTCNISLGSTIKPKFGVYFVRVTYNKIVYYGIANIGTRPTFDEGNLLLEVHIFSFDEMIYGAMIKVELLEFIREEKKFFSIDELKFQINKDVLFAKNYLLNEFSCS